MTNHRPAQHESCFTPHGNIHIFDCDTSYFLYYFDNTTKCSVDKVFYFTEAAQSALHLSVTFLCKDKNSNIE